MARRFVVSGTTGQTVDVFLQDRTSGDGVITLTTDKVKAAYRVGTTGAITTFALVGTNTTAAWASGGWRERSSTLMPGVYGLDVPDASITTPFATYFVQCSTAAQNFIPVAFDLHVVSSVGADIPVNMVQYVGQSQTSVNIGAMLTSVNAKVTSVDSRLSSMDTMLTSVNSHVTSADSRLTSVETNLATANSKLTSVDTKVSSMNTQVTSILANVTSIDSRLTSMDTMLSSVNSKVTSADSRLSSMDTMLTSVNAKVTSVESRPVQAGVTQYAGYKVAGAASQTIKVFLADRSLGDGVITMTTDKVKAAYSIGSTGPITTFALVGRNTTAAYVSGGWAEVSSTLAPGLYKLDVPDASIATTPEVSYFVQCSTAGQNFLPVTAVVTVVSSGGADLPVDVITYKGQAQTSVNIGAMLTSVNAKVTSVDSRLSSMDTMLSSVNSHVTSVDSRLTSMDTMLTSVNSKVTSVDTKVSSMNTQVTSILANVTSIDSRLTSMDTMLSSVNAKVTSIDTKVVSTSSTHLNLIADALLDRDMSVGTDSGSSAVRTPRQSLRFARNKWTVSGGTLTVYKEDDTVASWTAAVTTDAAASPITAADPA